MKKLLLLCNNKAGKNTIKKYIPDIIDFFNKAGFEVTVYISQYKSHVTNILLNTGEEYDNVVCCGGDGTLNETVTGIVNLEKKPVIGYIPCGSTNDFAVTLGIPLEIGEAYDVAVNGNEQMIDVGEINGKYFTYVSAFGIFTNVSYETPQNMKNMLGHLAYVLEGVKQIGNFPSYNITVEYDDGIINDDFVLGFVANSKRVGGFTIYDDNEIDLDDGLFEVILVRKIKNLNDVKDFMAFFLNSESNNNLIYSFKTSHIKFTSNEDINWTIDGEYCGSYKFAQIVNHKKAITIKK
ncbi:MAG: diacylglycerol/lipid kinase family protein [Lachnospirales bacterium]